MLRNGARWTVLRTKVLTLSAEQVWHKQWHIKFSSSISLCYQPYLRKDELRGKRAAQRVCASSQKPILGPPVEAADLETYLMYLPGHFPRGYLGSGSWQLLKASFSEGEAIFGAVAVYFMNPHQIGFTNISDCST